MRWWPWRRVEDTSCEAAAELAKLEERDAEIENLAKRLHEVQRRNNFSAMVDKAIARPAREEP